MYTNYEYYLNVYGGTLDADTFDTLLTHAEREIDRVTFGRLKQGGRCPFNMLNFDDKDSVNFATCKVIDAIHKARENGDRKVSSVTNGNYHETYIDSGKSLSGEVLTVAIENLPYYLIELDLDWRLP